MMDNKISTAQLATSDMLAFMYDEIDAIKKGKSVVDNTNSSDVLNPCSSAMPTRTSDSVIWHVAGLLRRTNATTIIGPDRT